MSASAPVVSTPAAGAAPIAAPVRRLVGIVLMVALGSVVLSNVLQLASPDANAPFGSDWWWYLDGPNRLLDARPLYDERIVAGPYMQLKPEFLFTWNQAPSLVLPVLAIAAIVPAGLEVAVWFGLMLAAVVAAFAVVWPRGLSVSAAVMLALFLAVLPPPLFGVWWAKAACLVALGVGLVIWGRRRNNDALIAAGLILAAVAKILPAIPLVLWLVVRGRRFRPIWWAAIAGVALVIPVVLIEGPSVLLDFVAATRNATIAGASTNIAPLVFLTFAFGNQMAWGVCITLSVVLAVAGLRRRSSDLMSLQLLTLATYVVVPNLWVHWLIAPMVIAVAMLGASSRRRLELIAGSSRLGTS